MNMKNIITATKQALSHKIASYKNIFIDAIYALDNMFAMYEALLKELRKRPQTNHLYLEERLEIYKYCIQLLLSSQREKDHVQESMHTGSMQQNYIIRRVSYTSRTA